jgi:hypothetical protein
MLLPLARGTESAVCPIIKPGALPVNERRVPQPVSRPRTEDLNR